MRQLIALSTLVAALVAVLVAGSTANAGGFATVGLSSLPTGVGPGESWDPEITIRQHGVTPLDGLTPTLTIRNASSGVSRDLTATPTGEPGVYRAHVVFPESGDWNISVATGWWGEGGLTAGPVTIEEAPGGGGDSDSFATGALAIGAVVVVLLAAATLGAKRRWGPTALPR
jgi:hypothetical protein